MNGNPEKQVESLFHEVLQSPAPEREALLQEACGGDAELRASVDELLRAHEEAGAFLASGAILRGSIRETGTPSTAEAAGTFVDNYKLLQQIGEGGFGIVWMAEQERPVRRRVAMKIIKAGMDTREVVARFEQERQALAMMDHPNIAKVFDAGSTPAGRPFFVMELVKGGKITDYCDEQKLPTLERLKLFIQVCHAIQHAHQKGIIHRDLKPSNILVTLHDGVPVPKVIDFGVAKATQQQRLTDLTLFTQFEQMVGTPLYMSPEQAERSGLDIDTRSDIYSLGVLLYELLTGRTPFDPGALMKQGLDEIRRVIREQEPPRPSTFVSTLALDLRTDLARHRQTDIAKLTGQIRGDLDWIVMKALEKDRNRRYETANGLAKDIERHLQSEPVQARPPSSGYRFRRFVRRNKAVVVAGGSVLAALLIGLAASTWMFLKEKHARQRATAAEATSSQVSQFLTDMLKGVGPSVALGRDTTLLREILDQTATRAAKDLKDQPEVAATLRSVLGAVYYELGDYVTAGGLHAESLAIRRKLLGNEHADVAASLNQLGQALVAQGKVAEAEPVVREALGMRRRRWGNEHVEVAESLNSLGVVLSNQRKPAQAIVVHRDALAIREKFLGTEHLMVAESLNNLASSLQDEGKLSEAQSIYQRALTTSRKLVGDAHPDVASVLNNLGTIFQAQGKFAEAEARHREALAIEEKLMSKEHPNVAVSVNNLAAVLERQGKLAAAEGMYRVALEISRKRLGSEHPDVAMWLQNLGGTLQAQNKLVEAEAIFREALAIRQSLSGNEHPEVAVLLNKVSEVIEHQGKLPEAETMRREALAMQRKRLGEEHPEVAALLNNLGMSLYKQGKLFDSESFLREAVEIYAKGRSQTNPNAALVIDNLAVVLADQRRYTEAEALHRKALAMSKNMLGSEHPNVATSLSNLAKMLEDQGKLTEAEPILREVLAITRRSTTSAPRDVEGQIHPVAENFYRQGKYAEAEPLYREVIESRQTRLKAEDEEMIRPIASLARLLADWAWSDCTLIADHDPEPPQNISPERRGEAQPALLRAEEAERLLRECLAARLRGATASHWRTDDTRSRLGGALLAVAVTAPALTTESRLAKLRDAESVLLEAHQSLLRIPETEWKYLRDSFVRLVRLYEALDKPDKAAAWQNQLDNFDTAEAQRDSVDCGDKENISKP